MALESSQNLTSQVTYQSRPFGGSWVTKTVDFFAGFEMDSQTHNLSLGFADSGGPWYLHKYHDSVTKASTAPWEPSDWGATFTGQYTIGYPAGGWSPTPVSPDSDLDLHQKGATAIARCSPTNPAFSLPTQIGELRADGIPDAPMWDLLRGKTKVARSAGSNYLNVEFGWKPLVSAVKDFAHTVQNRNAILDRYHKGSGIKIKSEYHFPDVSSVREYRGGFIPLPTDLGVFIDGVGLEINFQRTWFEGAYMYYCPPAAGPTGSVQRFSSDASKLLGIRLTPDTLWELAPWSWAIDWETNFGDVIANISDLASDSLVLQYGYLMQTTEQSLYYNSTSGGLSRTVKTVYKKRVPASRYGFGVDPTALTDRQIAIVAALGLSRT